MTLVIPDLTSRLDLLSGEGALTVYQRAMELERAGRTIIHLELGAPDVDPAPHIGEALIAAVRAGETRYVAPTGIVELREAIAADLVSRGVTIEPDQIIVTPSAKAAVFYALIATVSVGDEVLVPDPGFPIYPSVTRFAGATPVGYGIGPDNAPDVDEIESLISDRTRVLVLNSPNNPTGGALDTAATARVAELAAHHGLIVVTDDIYSRLVYDGVRAPCLAAVDAARDRTIVIDGFSKTYAMTGYRLGYLAVPARWVERLTTLAINGFTCVAPFIQRAGVAALKGPQDAVAKQVAVYRARRDLLVKGLDSLPGVRCPAPAGAFYVFPDFTEFLKTRRMTSREFANQLLEKHGVAAIDGAAFGPRGEGRLRLSFASAESDLEGALEGIRRAVKNWC